MRHLVMLVTQRPRTAVGALYRDHFAEGGLSRQDFEALLAGLTRARVLTLHDDVFEKDGKRISFQRVCLSDSSLALQTVRIPAAFEKPTRQKKKDGRKRRRAESEASGSSVPALETPLSLALREWRLSEARRSKIPAFRILSDRTLHALVAARPHSEATLLAVNGIGPSLLKKYGPSILSVIASTPAWPH